MNCPICKSNNLSVNGSVKKYITMNHRYLSCDDCGTTFQTKEEILEGTINEKFYLPFMEDETPNKKGEKNAS